MSYCVTEKCNVIVIAPSTSDWTEPLSLNSISCLQQLIKGCLVSFTEISTFYTPSLLDLKLTGAAESIVIRDYSLLFCMAVALPLLILIVTGCMLPLLCELAHS